MSDFVNTKERVKMLADQRKMTLAELERKLNISNGTIGKWDVRKPNTAVLEKVADFFTVSTDYLLGRTDRKDPWPASDPEEDFKDSLTDDEKIEAALASVMSYSGDPITDNDREILKGIIEGYLKSRK